MNKIAAILPFSLYTAGLGALLMADLLVTSYLPDQQVAQWAAIRSFIGISSVICLVGLDQVIMRTPESCFRILSLLLLQIPLIAAAVAWLYGFYDSETNSLYVFLVSASNAGGLALFQLFRSNRKRMYAQWSQQGWKILIGVLLAVAIFREIVFDLWQAVAIVTVLGLLSSLVATLSKFPKYDEQPKSLGWIYSIGFRSLTTSLLLALSIYAEQFVVGFESDASQAAYYFAHTTYFLLPVSVLNGYLAFNVAPWMRENKQLYLKHKSEYALRWLAIVIFYAIGLSLFGYLAWRLMRGENQMPNTAIQIAMLISSVARTAYTFPAGFAGAFGDTKLFDEWIIFQTASFGLAVAIYWLLSRQFQIDIIVAVATASAINWSVRALVGFSLCNKLERSLA